MYNWSVDEEKFKKEDPKSLKIWNEYKKEAKDAILSLLRSKWIKGGEVYVRRRQDRLCRQSPVMILIYLDDRIPKCDYVGLSFNFDDKISRNVSFTDKPKDVEKPRNYRLVGSFLGEK